MRDTEAALADVVLSVETLQSAVRRIRAEVAGPYEHIRARTRQLRNLHATISLLRHLIHRLKLVRARARVCVCVCVCVCTCLCAHVHMYARGLHPPTCLPSDPYPYP